MNDINVYLCEILMEEFISSVNFIIDFDYFIDSIMDKSQITILHIFFPNLWRSIRIRNESVIKYLNHLFRRKIHPIHNFIICWSCLGKINFLRWCSEFLLIFVNWSQKIGEKEILVKFYYAHKREYLLANPYARVSPPSIFPSPTVINELTRFHL